MFTLSNPIFAQEQQKGPIVPNFTLESNTGESISLSDYAGKKVVLNFWASWCPPCRVEMGEFQKLHNDLEESEEAVLLMLNQTDGIRETKEIADAFLKQYGYNFITLYDKGQVGLGIFGIPSIPITVVIDTKAICLVRLWGQPTMIQL